MTRPPREQAGVAAGSRGHAWDPGALFWDGYYAIVLAVTLLLVQTSAVAAGRERLIASLVLVAMAGWYLAFGRRVLRDAEAGSGPEMIYLGVLLAMFIVAESQTGTSAFILIAVCPQCFFASSSFRRAIAFVVAFNAVPVITVAVLATGQSRGQALAEASGIAALGIAFSVAYGSWILRIIDQSRDRANLIEQLEATRAELATANREAGVLAERQRLASEIHDTIAQGFTSIVMLIQAAESEIGRDEDTTRRYLRSAAATARENLAEARALVAALTPAHLVPGSLDGALRRLAERTEAEHELPAAFEVTGTVRPLPAAVEVMLLRVCQEALANVRKHARARQAWVRLAYGRQTVRLEVADDGAGFDPAQVNGGYGLRGMRGRVGAGEGTLLVRSAPGQGTSVSVEVPA